MAVAVAAWFTVPLPASPAPQSLQSLAVVLVGGLLGGRTGMLAVLAYLVVGALGAPVFAEGGAGIDHLAGASGGYLVGFVFGAGMAGVWHRRRPSGGFGGALAVMLAAHVVILFFGWARLAMSSSGGQAFAAGVAPFVVGGVAKSAVAALVLVAWERWRNRARSAPARG